MRSLIPTLMLATLFFAGSTAQAQNPGALKVKGEAIIKTVPEEMIVRIPIEVKDKEYKPTSDKLIRTYNALVDALVKAGLDKDALKSNSLNITEDYNYVERERILIGYVGRIQMIIEIEHDAKVLQTIMETLGDDRFKFGYNLGFKLSKKQEDALLEEAIKMATADARQKAKILAEALEVEIGDIVEINYEHELSGGAIPIYRERMVAEDAAFKSGGLELNPQEMEIRKEVRIVWNIEER